MSEIPLYTLNPSLSLPCVSVYPRDVLGSPRSYFTSYYRGTSP